MAAKKKAKKTTKKKVAKKNVSKNSVTKKKKKRTRKTKTPASRYYSETSNRLQNTPHSLTERSASCSMRCLA